jgi:hypothetical protein
MAGASDVVARGARVGLVAVDTRDTHPTLLGHAATAEASPAPFDAEGEARWSMGDRGPTVRTSAIVDSSASELGEEGVRIWAEARIGPRVLAVIDLDVDLLGVRPTQATKPTRTTQETLTPARRVA